MGKEQERNTIIHRLLGKKESNPLKSGTEVCRKGVESFASLSLCFG
jgi:hypothetical protein